jgi:hypothetical protein
MPIPALLLIQGLPHTGKSRLAHLLSGDLLFPLFSYEKVKEKLISSEGWQADSGWQEHLDHKSYLTLFFAAESYLRNRNSLILEANFSLEKHSQPLQKLITAHPSRVLQIVCGADSVPLMIPGRIYHWDKADSGLKYRILLLRIREWLNTPDLENMLSIN